MLKRGDYIRSISDKLAVLSKAIEFRGKLNLHDLNIVAEHFVANILNLKNNWELKNLNSKNGSFPSIDLGDVKNRIAIQVTSTKTSEKISNTLKLAKKNKLQKDFDSFIVFVLLEKQKRYTKIVIPKGISFDWKKDIWDWGDVVKGLNHLSLDVLEEIDSFLQSELKIFVNQSNFSDRSAIAKIRQYFNSGMLKDDFAVEGNMEKFLGTLNKHIELLTTGKIDSRFICKAYYDFDDDSVKKTFEVTHERFLVLRRLYISSVKKGEIDLTKGLFFFDFNSLIPQSFNLLRKEIVGDLNKVFKANGIKEISLSY